MRPTMQKQTFSKNIENIVFRKPTADDGKNMYQLVKKAKTLDLNSPYSYLMWAKYFYDTSVIAENDDTLIGFVSGYILPNSPETLFVWQIAVDEEQREKGLATRLLVHLLKQTANKNIRYIEATVTPSNTPSKKLFKSLADKLNTKCEVDICFSAEQFPNSSHEPEFTYRIGPINERKNN